MADDEDNDLLNLLLDDDTSLSSTVFTSETKATKRRIRKQTRTMLQCVVCGDHAEGYNFDAISCESCKAFFRRNALRPPGRLKCRGTGNCVVNVQTRKRCKKCRLDKCFRMGMRKDWILSEEDKKKKRGKIEENRRRRTQQPVSCSVVDICRSSHRVHRVNIQSNIRTSSNSDDSSLSQNKYDERLQMSENDWKTIQSIQDAYNKAISLNRVIGVPLYPATQPIHSTLELIRIPTYLASIRLITYLKNIPNFDQFDAEDRIILVKHNLLAVVFMHVILLYDPIADTYHEHNTEDPIFKGEDWAQILGDEFYRQLTSTAKQLIHILEYDRVVVKMLLLIILYTKGFCSYDIEHEPSLIQPKIVLKNHNDFTELLFKYCSHQYGFERTVMIFTRLINPLQMIQRLAIQLKNLVHKDILASDLSPLMQSVLQLNGSHG